LNSFSGETTVDSVSSLGDFNVLTIVGEYTAASVSVDSPYCSSATCTGGISGSQFVCFRCIGVPVGITVVNFTATKNGECAATTCLHNEAGTVVCSGPCPHRSLLVPISTLENPTRYLGRRLHKKIQLNACCGAARFR
jgi:hypothetical protein